MADIGAAPFTAASPTSFAVSVAVKSRKRPRSSLPVIKVPLTKKPERLAAEIKSSSRTKKGLISEVRYSFITLIFGYDRTLYCSQFGPPVKRRRKAEPISASDRPKRVSAGKTLDFLAQVSELESQYFRKFHGPNSRSRAPRRTSSGKVRGARRSKTSVVAEQTSPVPTLKPSPAPLNVRRSGRSHIVPSRIRDSESAELQPESHDAWTPAKNVNPNSALGILRRVSRYSRPIRSPSPQPSAALPKRVEKAAASPKAPTTTSNTEVGLEESKLPGPSERQRKEVSSPSKEEFKTISDTSKKDDEGPLGLSGEQINEPSKSHEEGSKPHEEESEVRPDVAESSTAPADNLTNAETTEAPAPSISDDKDNEEKPVEETKDPEKAKSGNVVGVSPSAHATIAAGRISSRAVRPSSRFLNADFISPLRRRRGKRSLISAREHVVPVKTRTPAKRYISPWSHYVPSVKPVLGNVYYNDEIRPRVPSPFDPEKEERLRREAEQREKQKRLTMPLYILFSSWNEFDMDGDDGLDVTTIEAVHIPKLDDYVAPPEMDESAEPVAAAVEKLLMRPMAYADDDGISFLQERALEQPELRRNLLAMAIDCISSLHIARLSATGREAAVMVYNAVTTQASKMRDVICMFSREPDDDILLTYCPTLFVVGSEACDYHPGAMKYMRANMISE
ncbi:hypothetical protein TELCIR_11655 [Teladorsagia circumcincta]|uniref:KANSL3 helical domain-containing protein n=1 Tax=Teladorsagia circumcincta TaxID=45464 RepID=A0A2G9U8V7_TELCI|nr:hypothetical protein TELCIR_11655 [Teladorsagia circumcincta]